MRYLLIAAALVFLSAPAHAAPEGKWLCNYKEPAIKGQAKLHFAGGKLIFDRGSGRDIITDIVMTDDYVFWKSGLEFEFFPKENRMTRTSGSGTDELACVKQ